MLIAWVIATAVRCDSPMLQKMFGTKCHLSIGSLRQLAADGLVDGFNFDKSKEIGFCESCVVRKHHESPFPVGGGTRAKEPLGLVVCGKVNARSIGGAEYFLTFVDDKTRYVWMYFLRHKCSLVFWSGKPWWRKQVIGS